MNCDDVHKLIDTFLDGELDTPTELAAAEHIHACPRCAAALGRRRTTSRLVKAAMRSEPVAERERDRLRETLRTTSGLAPPPRRRRPLFAFGTAALAMVALLTWMLVPFIDGKRDAERYVYHVSNSDNAAVALLNVRFHLDAAPRARFVVVTHNEGVDFLLRDAKDDTGAPFAPRIAELAARGVEFRVCQNTLKLRDIAPSQVVALAQLVPSGIAEVGRLQTEEGFAYLKP